MSEDQEGSGLAEQQDYSDEDVLALARRYAAMQLRKVIDGDSYTRHDVNNATKIVGYLMKQSDAEDSAPELGLLLEQLRKGETTEEPEASEL